MRSNVTTFATRIRELNNLEGFDVIPLNANGVAVDLATNGLPAYGFDRRAKGTMTVSEWKRNRFKSTYSGYDCKVLYGDGNEAHGNATLEAVRKSYESD